jgi:HTH-type transcriptional regulator/antitoxin HigA
MLKPIKNMEEHDNYLARAFELMQQDLSPNSKESDELEVISIIIEAYEKENFPIESPNPIDAILFRLDQLRMPKNIT